MKKIVFLIVGLLGFHNTHAQDTIPFLDPCLGYPVSVDLFLNPIPLDSMVSCITSYGSLAVCTPLNDLYWKFQQDSCANIYGIAVMSGSTPFPAKGSFLLSIYNEDTGEITPIDSICGMTQEQYYCKPMSYDVHGIRQACVSTSNIQTCSFYLFDHIVNILGPFCVGYKWYTKVEDMNENDFYEILTWDIGDYCYYFGYVLDEDSGRWGIQGYWGGIFPILQLPCVTPRKPQTETHRAGHARISWHPGDTALYQLVFRSPNGTVVLETDTLADTSFVLTDSLIADTSLLREGWCSVSLRKACNYMDSPYHTIVWSDWSEPKRFYYTPYRDINGISTPVVEPPYFTLAPNPAEGDVTVTFGEPLPEGCTLDLFGPDGRLLSSLSIPATATTFQLATNQYPTGLYLLRLSTPVSSSSRKLSIVR